MWLLRQCALNEWLTAIYALNLRLVTGCIVQPNAPASESYFDRVGNLSSKWGEVLNGVITYFLGPLGTKNCWIKVNRKNGSKQTLSWSRHGVGMMGKWMSRTPFLTSGLIPPDPGGLKNKRHRHLTIFPLWGNQWTVSPPFPYCAMVDDIPECSLV